MLEHLGEAVRITEKSHRIGFASCRMAAISGVDVENE